jgi:hypothetical protein
MPCFRRAGGGEDEDGESHAGENGGEQGQKAGVEQDFATGMA